MVNLHIKFSQEGRGFIQLTKANRRYMFVGLSRLFTANAMRRPMDANRDTMRSDGLEKMIY